MKRYFHWKKKCVDLEKQNVDINKQNVDIKKLYTEFESKYDKLLNSVKDTEYGNYGVQGWSTDCMANQYLCSTSLL